jgi:hypothetical protein
VQAFLDWIGAWPDLQGMLDDFSRYAGISEGFHAKMSLLIGRKSTSTLSYAERAVPIRTFLSHELLGSMRISLMPSAGSKDPVVRLASGASSAISSLMIASSSEAMTVEASSQLSTSH